VYGSCSDLVTPSEDCPEGQIRHLGRRSQLEPIVVAIITGIVTLVGVVMSNSKSRAVMEVKVDALAEMVEKHNRLVERTYELERGLAVVRNDVESLKGKADRSG
jgi:hypothetical protein